MVDAGTKTDPRIPVTLVTGYLGAGKTSFVNDILGQSAGKKFAIIVNEYGDIGIDGELINTGSEELIELTSGCLCCVVRGDLIKALRQLLIKSSQWDGIIIETTGLANPSPVIQCFFADQILAAQCRLDAVVTLVDALHGLGQIAKSRDARDQIALASVIVLNKAHGATQLIESKLHQLAPFAKILRTTQAKVPAAAVLHQKSFTSDHVETLLTQFPHVADHHHTHEIESVSLMVEQAIDPKKFERWLSDLLMLHGLNILRCKGIVHFEGSTQKYIVQAVHMLASGDFTSAWGSDDLRRTRLVFIGRGIQHLGLSEGLLNTCAAPKPPTKADQPR